MFAPAMTDPLFPSSLSGPLFSSAPLPHDYAAGAKSDRALTRAYELLGGVPRTIDVALLDDDSAPPTLVERLERARAAIA